MTYKYAEDAGLCPGSRNNPGRHQVSKEGQSFMERRDREWVELERGILQAVIKEKLILLLDQCHDLAVVRSHPLFSFFVDFCLVRRLGEFLTSFTFMPNYEEMAWKVLSMIWDQLEEGKEDNFLTIVKKVELINECRALYNCK